METAVVISGNNNDLPHIRPFTDENYHTRSIKRFKMPFDATEGEGAELVDGRVGIIVVNNMLLTGFDAPIEQVLYLDRVIIAHNLLQAIARVNRPGDEHKDKGFVIDYVGVGNDLKRALDSYAEREQQELLDSIGNPQDNINALVQAYREVMELLKKYGVTDFADPDAFFDLFYDEDIRFFALPLPPNARSRTLALLLRSVSAQRTYLNRVSGMKFSVAHFTNNFLQSQIPVRRAYRVRWILCFSRLGNGDGFLYQGRSTIVLVYALERAMDCLQPGCGQTCAALV